MPITTETTPNPNAMKFTIGQPVGGPVTHTPDSVADEPLAKDLLDIDDVVSMFMTADFITLTKAPGADWDTITPRALSILERHFD